MKNGLWTACFIGALLLALTAWAGEQPTDFSGTAGGPELQMKVKEEFSLTKDGKTLTVKTSRMSPRGTTSAKQTFKKAA